VGVGGWELLEPKLICVSYVYLVCGTCVD
jgi:hypothetical protein